MREILQMDWKRHTDTSRLEVEALLALDPLLVKDAWIRIRGWYHEAEELPPPPACVTIVRMAEERVEIYRRAQTPPGRIIPVALDPFPCG